MVDISDVIGYYYPNWEPPPDVGDRWSKCLCPFHGDGIASAAVNYARDGFNCFACGVGGDVYSIIMHEEGISFATALQRAKEILVGGDPALPISSQKQPRRRVSEKSRNPRRGKPVRSRVRSGPSPWA